MQNLRRILRAPRKLTFTLEGKWFVGITVVLGFGAMNTGNNLLYLVLGMMLGMIIASGVLSERVLKRVVVTRIPPGDVFANRPTHLSVEVENQKRVYASYSITIGEHEARLTRRRRRRAQGLPEERPRRKKARDAEGDMGAPKVLMLRVPAGESQVGTCTYVFPQRGVYAYVGLDLSTRFPFGFFEKTRRIEVPSELLVFPEVRTHLKSRVDDTPLMGEVARQVQGRTGDFFGLREYRDGDDLRDVHWKVSARRNKLVRRLYEREDNESVALYLYNWIEAEGAASHAAIEEAIIEVASTCALLTRRGFRYSLTTIDERVPDGAGPGQLKSCLRHLALLSIETGGDPPALLLRENPNRLLFAAPDVPALVRGRFEHVRVASVEVS